MDINQHYKNWHKPDTSERARTLQGYYRVCNSEKYIGNVSTIIYRSSWELAFCKYCDMSPSVLRWSSEPIRIPYYDRVSKLEECKKLGLDPNNPKNWVIKNYHTDFWYETDKGDGTTEKMFIEIKPSYKLKKPFPPEINAPLREVRKFNKAASEFLINEAKFAALKAWAEKHGAKFYVFTEHTLSHILGRFWQEIEKE